VLQQQRQQQADRHARDHGQQHEPERGQQDPAELGVGEQVGVVRQADQPGRPAEDVAAGEREVDRTAQRDEEERDEDQQRRDQVRERRQVVPQARSAYPAAADRANRNVGHVQTLARDHRGRRVPDPVCRGAVRRPTAAAGRGVSMPAMEQLPATMRAAYVSEPGPAESIVIGELPVPTPGHGQVLVRVELAAVNHVDTFVRSGAYRTRLPLPFVIGRDLAGTVVATGPGVTGPAPGAPVWCNSLGHDGRPGSFAEYVAVDADRVYPLPDGVSAERAVAAAHAAGTAHLGLHREARVRAGETVLVDGAAGAAGTAALRTAAAAGCRTIAVSSARALAAVRGADRVIARERLDAELDEPVDVWWDGSGRLDPG